MPLATPSVNLAGQSSKVGGTVARVVGWLVLVVGTLLGFGTLATCGAIVGFATAAPYVIGLPILAVTAILSWVLLKSGRDLHAAGGEAEKATRARAVFALANTRGGVLVPVDVAHALGVTPEEGDAILTALAKENPDHVSLDVDDNGTLLYRFSAALWGAMDAGQRARVDVSPDAFGAVRVDARDPIDDEVAATPPRAREVR